MKPRLSAAGQVAVTVVVAVRVVCVWLVVVAVVLVVMAVAVQRMCSSAFLKGWKATTSCASQLRQPGQLLPRQGFDNAWGRGP